MKTIVAIGGGEIGELETLSIDRAIVKLTKKDHPNVLFIPTASSDSTGYAETFQKVYGKKLGCDIDVLYLLKEKLSKKEIEKKILSADIIYVGGGNTLRMMKAWRKNGVDGLLRKAHKKGIILAGLSAGSICWFRYGSSDARRFANPKDTSFMRVRGLGIIPLTVSPHHIREKKLRDAGLVKLIKRTPGIGLALDDYTAILIQDDRYEILKSKKDVGIVKVFRNKGKIEQIPLKSSGTLVELLEKK
ncbi:MAG: peptidase E [Candidatus Moranbacteria bacterium]|nr:peptidase E [Candidatus Moranbacteria bacterium]MDD3964847.1 peptidase E [Candidatus Moranbacteria bacterium]